jgi:endonuclease/exonuclease/phosphatase family metal-dependent hydrolase
VVSWNVENFFDVYDDPYSRDQVTKPAYVSEGRQKNVAAVLKELNADVVALQEVENRYLLQEFVDKYLPEMRYQVVLVEGNDTRGIDVALLSKIPIEEVATYQHRRFQSSAGEIMGFRRDLLRVKLGAPYNGDIYVVHLKSQFGDKVADVVREAEATEMVKIMAENGAGNPDYRAMITGDFNEVPDMPTLDIFRNSGLVDVMEGSEKYSYNKKPYLTRIDYGLMTPERQKDLGRAEILDELGDHNLRACSDHFPLLLEWE